QVRVVYRKIAIFITDYNEIFQLFSECVKHCFEIIFYFLISKCKGIATIRYIIIKKNIPFSGENIINNLNKLNDRINILFSIYIDHLHIFVQYIFYQSKYKLFFTFKIMKNQTGIDIHSSSGFSY